ncbi:deoxycytidyl transferase [Coemansia sp. RSA 2618]|nr:deoxycytidyl transferase [Coemansia sp. RSA 2618]
MSAAQQSSDNVNSATTTTEYQLGPADCDGARSTGDCSDLGDSKAGLNAGNEESLAPGFGDFHTYFDQRKRKLAEQAQQSAEQAPKYKPIFAGVVFHINGYTQPSHYELKKLLIERGGRFLHYLSKTQVTHIIASNLARSKEKELRNYKVVHPEWVVESVRANRLLSWRTYQLGNAESRGVPMTFLGTDEIIELGKDDSNTPNAHGYSVELQAEKVPDPVLAARPPRLPQRIIVDKYGEGLNREWVRKNLATEQDFIQRYYANSRLHHLSTWKAEMKDYVAQLRQEFRKDARPASTCKQRIIIHVDFDCFFVSASLLSHPHLQGNPVAVCHSQQSMQPDDDGHDMKRSEYSANSSQIASCNYIARSFGVRNGMFIGQARELCPALATVPYCFDSYKRISKAFYRIITQIADETQAVSVDEALLDVTGMVERDYLGDAEALAHDIRRRVLDETQCIVSVGIGPSILLARLATAKAKPDGILALDIGAYHNMSLGVRELPGVGHVVEDALARRGIKTVADIRAIPLHELKSICGEKTAITLHNFSQGVDNRVLESDKLRQAFGADIGWGVRFSNQCEADDFVARLAAEVCKAMVAANRIGSLVTIKIKKRQESQGKPAKFLGHGICDNLSKSTSLSQMTNDVTKVSVACVGLLHGLAIDPLDIRAVGIQIQRLNSFETGTSIGDMLAKSKAQTANTNKSGASKPLSAGFELPSASQLDMDVVSELPESIQQELRAALHNMDNRAEPKTANAPDISPAQPALAPSKSTSTKTNKGSFGSRRGRPRKLLFPTSNTTAGKTKSNLLDSFRKLESMDSIMPSQMDGDVWKHLPVNIRRELVRDYVKSKPANIVASKECDLPSRAVAFTDIEPILALPPASEYAGPKLLGKHLLDDVKALVKEWTGASRDGPLAEDIAEFADYVEGLVKSRDLMKANIVFKHFKACIRSDLGTWQDAANTVAARVNQTCMAMYQAHLV